jgi:hypothetical protein
VESACRRVRVTPYREDGGWADDDDSGGGVGVGQLRYVAIKVERRTGGCRSPWIGMLTLRPLEMMITTMTTTTTTTVR